MKRYRPISTIPLAHETIIEAMTFSSEPLQVLRIRNRWAIIINPTFPRIIAPIPHIPRLVPSPLWCFWAWWWRECLPRVIFECSDLAVFRVVIVHLLLVAPGPFRWRTGCDDLGGSSFCCWGSAIRSARFIWRWSVVLLVVCQAWVSDHNHF